MTGRRVDLSAGSDQKHGDRRWMAIGLGVVAVLAVGIAIGSRIAKHTASAVMTVTVTAPSTGAARPPDRSATPAPRGPAGYPRTRQGAIAAASAYVTELDGPALLDAKRVGGILRVIATSGARDQLIASYDEAAAQARQQLGVNTVPAPVVIVRAALIGYQLAHFTPNAATVAIWRVGIVGSGASIQPEQSWRTETVGLVWENGWKVASLASEPGPTPPLVTTAVSTPAQLFSSIPQFEEFSRVDP